MTPSTILEQAPNVTMVTIGVPEGPVITFKMMIEHVVIAGCETCIVSALHRIVMMYSI